tara:strand:+ start:192 stop:782 length:591 start_codon:yes stop_codon:yes gene_type:complete
LKKYFQNKNEILNNIISIIKENKNPFIISGGNTIKDIFKDLDQKINNIILLSDERLVKKNSKLRNDIFFEKLIKKKLILSKNFISYKLSKIDKISLSKLNNKISKINFKLAILSLGSNGHFASIFKKKKEIHNYYFIQNSTKFPKSRVTISLKKLKKCSKIIFVASLKTKKKEIKNFNKNRLIKFLGFKKVRLFVY